MRTMVLIVLTMSASLLMAAPVAAGRDAGLGVIDAGHGHTESEVATTGLDEVRQATAAYHWLPMALDDGFVPFAVDGSASPTCFDSESGGMGVHYVRNVDAVVDATDPEAIVYEVTEGGGLRLVGVEYVVPQEFVEDEDGNVVALPELHGHEFHKHATLPLYILHAWIWAENPGGMFADFNPAVAACPANLASQSDVMARTEQ